MYCKSSSFEKSSFNISFASGCGSTKMNDRYEWFLEKATELAMKSHLLYVTIWNEKQSIKKD
jgi:hypothetical protein